MSVTELAGPVGWHRDAACRGMFSTTEGDDLFFDYGRSEIKIQKAKNVCARCPVWRECRRDNMEVPRGIFGGLTERERWALLGRGDRRPDNNEAYAFFAQFFDAHDLAHRPSRSRAAV